MTQVSSLFPKLFPRVLVEIVYEYWETDKIVFADPSEVGVLNKIDPFLNPSTNTIERETMKNWFSPRYTSMFAYNGLWWNFTHNDDTILVKKCDLLKCPEWKTEVVITLDPVKIISRFLKEVAEVAIANLSSPFLDPRNDCVYFLFEVGPPFDLTYLVFFNFLSSSWNYEFLGKSVSKDYLRLAYVSRNKKELTVVCFSLFSDGFLILTKEENINTKQTEGEKFFINICLKPSEGRCMIADAKIMKNQQNRRPWIWFLGSLTTPRSRFLAKIPFPRKRNMNKTIFITRKQIHSFEYRHILSLALLNEQTLMVIEKHSQFTTLEIEHEKEEWLHLKYNSKVWVCPQMRRSRCD
jgi:hypothetical protein